ncbi:hypothetical protein CcaverHIS002_0304080 [Cutaneotrichosporon cavernicola]|uniref:Sedlin n=1 Tax=Cutaneotrichosporon cavernicola TaxID=279322 RepID=A0AA48L1W7_9TREE|nr:uncharacterized protein CcaverHIS019_0304050 [Cutaneotrichosporon cavernicola]BEI82540.1 hypothetical protein CcaverHIS002_0304080 [Cutaneotrichosporon cavernicola]BEI90335.1 hypothetical protein CcaverHIS019_0304050 [Cutaneotrichosporon cavernicola]BEI98111.1 hypothetical protein CcaverHIS631_0304100 [Cutaneotrichosporon cavernicola]BEJ05888.1 hypothetical protein CcaverHIS641_0304100 [Cutaneotrichosporon cavernicola]
MSFYLAIVSPLDTPLFELSFNSSKPAPPSSASSASFSWSSFNGPDATPVPSGLNLGLVSGPGVERHLLQMIAHAALDTVEEVAEGTGSLYLKNVDKHNEWMVSAFLATNVKFVLLHDTKNDDGIRVFFGDVWELYVKAALNPFHTVNTSIRTPLFEARVRASARKYL